MSFIDKLKSVFIESDPSVAANSGATSRSDSKQTSSVNAAVEIKMESNEKFADILSRVLEANNQTGFDYLEYKKAVQSIAKLQNMEESAQFKTAFAAAMAMNIQPNHLVDSAKKYLSVLENEYTRFNQTVSQFLQTQVGNKEGESALLNQTIKDKENQLQQLQSDLEKHRARLKEIESEIKTAKSKVDTNKASFKFAYDQLVGQIQSDIQKMEQYLK